MQEELKADQDWKEQARQEKERLAKELEASAEKEAGAGEDAVGGQLPPPEFMTLLTGLATQVLIALGEAPDPFSGKQHSQLDLARYNIDMLGMLEEKTKGNLSEGEATALKSVLSDLRLRYVDAASKKASDAGG
ncbi:MAG: DUF1844 domain-containing protein [Planctomycetota bacterium]